MSFAQNLVQAVANAAGDEGTVDRIQADKQHQLAMADLFRKNEIDRFNAVSQNISKALASGQILDPQTQQLRPLTDDEKTQLQSASQQVSAHIKNLYNPNFDPQRGVAIESPIRQLTDKLHITQAPDKKTAGEVIKNLQSIAQRNIMLTPGTDEALASQRKRAEESEDIAQKVKLSKQYGLPETTTNEVIARGLGVAGSALKNNWKPITGTIDGLRVTLQQNQNTSEVTDLAGNEVPAEKLAKFQMDNKSTFVRPKHVWGQEQDGRYFSVNLDPFTNQEIQGTRNYNEVPPSSITGRITKGEYFYVDDVGNLKSVPRTTASIPNRPSPKAGGASPAASTASGTAKPATAKTPGQAKKELQAMAGGTTAPSANSNSVKVIDFKGNKLVQDSKQVYEDAIDRQIIMHENLENALKGDQQAMLSLVANHIGMTLGAQKGARINQAVWNEAVASTPWMDKVKAKFDDRGYLSGVTLAPEQMQQMVRLADEKVGVLHDRLGRIYDQAGRKNPYPKPVDVDTKKTVDNIVNILNGQKTPGAK